LQTSASKSEFWQGYTEIITRRTRLKLCS